MHITFYHIRSRRKQFFLVLWLPLNSYRSFFMNEQINSLFCSLNSAIALSKYLPGAKGCLMSFSSTTSMHVYLHWMMAPYQWSTKLRSNGRDMQYDCKEDSERWKKWRSTFCWISLPQKNCKWGMIAFFFLFFSLSPKSSSPFFSDMREHFLHLQDCSIPFSFVAQWKK